MHDATSPAAGVHVTCDPYVTDYARNVDRQGYAEIGQGWVGLMRSHG